MRIPVLAFALIASMLGACASLPPYQHDDPPLAGGPSAEQQFNDGDVVGAVESWLGVSAETAGTITERVFQDLGEPNGYIYGEEVSGAAGAGLRYGRGVLVLNDGRRRDVFWQGPSVGWDVGGNASKTFTLVYDIADPDDIYRRFPGVEGTAYLIGGAGVNYQRADGITLAPIRAGVGARLGANIGYLSYSRKSRWFPF